MLTNTATWIRAVALMFTVAMVSFPSSSAEACHRNYYGAAYYARPAYVVPYYSPVTYPVQVSVARQAQPSTVVLVNQAKQMLKARQYAAAQQAINVALQREPKNAALLQLKSLISFAQADYQSAAATAYSALTLGRAFDWNIVQQLYPSANEYTQDYYGLTAAAKAKPDQAQLQFLLAYHHLMLGHQLEGRMALEQAQKMLPQDKLIPVLLSQLPQATPVIDEPVSAKLAADDTAPLPTAPLPK